MVHKCLCVWPAFWLFICNFRYVDGLLCNGKYYLHCSWGATWGQWVRGWLGELMSACVNASCFVTGIVTNFRTAGMLHNLIFNLCCLLLVISRGLLPSACQSNISNNIHNSLSTVLMILPHQTLQPAVSTHWWVPLCQLGTALTSIWSLSQ